MTTPYLVIKVSGGYLMTMAMTTETGSESAIGLEIQAQAFALRNNPLNDMTFYNYKIINRSTSALNETYFVQWAYWILVIIKMTMLDVMWD